jgi:hypothetical protein
LRFLFLGTSTVIVGAVLLVSPLVAPPGVVEAVAREIREITSVWTSNYPHERTWACRGGLMPTVVIQYAVRSRRGNGFPFASQLNAK